MKRIAHTTYTCDICGEENLCSLQAALCCLDAILMDDKLGPEAKGDKISIIISGYGSCRYEQGLEEGKNQSEIKEKKQ